MGSALAPRVNGGSASDVAPVQQETAPAKINLALHVTGRRADGYHLLHSLVVFAANGDGITVAESDADRLEIAGPFAAAIPSDADNILLRALTLARAALAAHGRALPPVAIRLDKQLPVAAGIGGGSADAAALLRLVQRRVPQAADALMTAALGLGADVPMCLDGRAAVIGGIGEAIQPLSGLPPLPMVLVNPGTPVSTPAVFAGLERRDGDPLPALPDNGFASIADLARWLRLTRNDLQAPALTLAPSIATVTDALQSQGALMARMSGSGATVWGLYPDEAVAGAAAAALRLAQPDWWVMATVAGGRMGKA
ncbi:4-(cytidine 5'-diphospho)-2-C-methyl-D-erythritol kinase [Mangrovicella endophytica]|uniref:4-(cytidine 5'-diphospho)-2-C-methyl-D-erythritol kinase n=1 Tax=Mangrovicella endophytica TaxID=2066697 RepID=UPI000C9DE3B7|nr:4-(cytidine 5'-diphospho)-2-C-methyl-D-erythritol kinase [Mangrovicella endophytica]